MVDFESHSKNYSSELSSSSGGLICVGEGHGVASSFALDMIRSRLGIEDLNGIHT